MTVLNLSAYDEALLERLNHEAEAIESELHGPNRHLLTKEESKNLREALHALYARIAGVVNRYDKA